MAENKEEIVVKTTKSEQTDVIEKAKGFWSKYSKKVIYAGTLVIAVLAGLIAYQKFVKEPKEENANETIFLAETLFGKLASTSFGKDSVNIVLNGGELDGVKITGLLKVINNYDGTAAANRARYMTGATYLHVKEFDKAIKYLKDFNGNGADQIQSKAYVLLGHAYAEKKQTSEALNYYKKAAEVNEKDQSVSPDALMLAAGYAEFTGKNDEAISLYKKIKDKYPTYTVVNSGELDKILARLGVLN